MSVSGSLGDRSDEECAFCAHPFHGFDQCPTLDRWGPGREQQHDPCSCDGGLYEEKLSEQQVEMRDVLEGEAA